MLRQKLFFLSIFLGVSFLFCNFAKADWQSTLQSTFPSAKVVETFDDLQDWGANGQNPSGSGDSRAYNSSLLPKKSDGSNSLWKYWNNKLPTFEFTSTQGTLLPSYLPLTNLNGTAVTWVSGPLFQTSWIGRKIDVPNLSGVPVTYTIADVPDNQHLTLSSAAQVQNNIYVTVWGDVITGLTSGASCRIAQIWNVDGHSYIQMTWTCNAASNFQVGETFRNEDSTKTGTMVGWPLAISNHGTNEVWQGTGKSLAMDLGDNDLPDTAMAGLGAQRLGTYFGDGTPKSGLKKAYIFMMTKFSPTYFGSKPFNLGTDVLKWLDLDSGFTDINHWGSTQDQSQVNTYGSIDEYGYNFNIYDWMGGGMSFPNNIFDSFNTYHPVSSDGGVTWSEAQTSLADNGRDTGADITAPYLSNDWFGVEIASDIGTVDNSDGTFEIWIYDKNGNQIGHQLRTGLPALVHFDHLWNKTVIGGNRRYGSDESARDLRYWVDDFIVNGSQIAPTYFSTLHTYQSNSSTTYSNTDFTSLVSNWLKTGTSSDLNADGTVNTQDLGIMMSKWN